MAGNQKTGSKILSKRNEINEIQQNFMNYFKKLYKKFIEILTFD